MTVVAGAVLVLFVVSSTDLRDKQQFRPTIPIGLVSVQASRCCDAGTAAALDEAGSRTAALVGGGTHVVIGDASTHGGALVAQNPDCAHGAIDDLAVCQYHSLGVASADAIDLIAGHSVPAARRALADGGAVLLDSTLATGHTVEVGVPSPRKNRTSTRLGAVVIPGVPSYGGFPQLYVSTATAAANGWTTHGLMALVKPTASPSNAQLDRAQQALGTSVVINLQHDYDSRYSVALLAMLGAAAIATLAGTSIAVALAMAESRADMATLAAVGASPVRRRVHAMGQAATVAGLGTGIGVVLGTLVAVATLSGSSLYPTSAPLRWLAAVIFGAPLLAVAVAGVFTRSRVPMTRRIA